MNYFVSVWADRIEVETAYSALESAGCPLSQVSILGRGYKTADEFGLIDPNEEARKQIRLMGTWLVPFGFGAGVTFSVGIAFGSGDALPYRNRLNAGQYLLVVQGNETLIRQAQRVIRPLNPESVKTYEVQPPS